MSELVVEILENCLGNSKKHNTNTSQISFDCPVCSYEIKGLSDGDGKGNLEVNYNFNVFKCWSCSETHETHGTIYKLIKEYGNKDLLKKYKLITPDLIQYHKPDIEKKTIDGLPNEFTPLTIEREEKGYKSAISYLKKRNIGLDIIKKYNIGYCSYGEYGGRIIFPSYDIYGDINYYSGRSYDKYNKLKYKNPDVSKSEIIFNEWLVNWDSNVYLVEGVFDHIVVPNSLPLLGKVISDNLFSKVVKNCECKVIILLDSDAYEDSMKLYKRLNSTKLMGRVLIVKLPEGYDISDIYNKLGSKGVLKVLNSAKKIKESLL